MRGFLSAFGIGTGSLVCLLAALTAIAISVFLNAYFAFVRTGGDFDQLAAGELLNGAVAFAILFAAFDILKSFGPVFVSRAWAHKNYGYVFVVSIMTAGFIGLSAWAASGLMMELRTGLTSKRQAKVENKDELEIQLRETRQRIKALGYMAPAGTIEAQLEAQRQQRRWKATQGCTDATANKSRTFCTNYNELQAKLAKAKALETDQVLVKKLSGQLQSIRQSGGVKAVDPQLKSLSAVTGFKAAKIEFGFLVAVVIIVELTSAFGILFALGHGPAKPLNQAATELTPDVATHPETSRAKTTVIDGVVNENDIPALPPPDIEPPEEAATYCVARLKLAPGGTVPLSEVFSDYRLWCQQAGKDAMSRAVFTAAMGEVANHTDAVELAIEARKKVVKNVAFIEAVKAA